MSTHTGKLISGAAKVPEIFGDDELERYAKDCNVATKLKTFKFTSISHIEAKTEEEAKEKFANESFDFAANAQCEEVDDR